MAWAPSLRAAPRRAACSSRSLQRLSHPIAVHGSMVRCAGWAGERGRRVQGAVQILVAQSRFVPPDPEESRPTRTADRAVNHRCPGSDVLESAAGRGRAIHPGGRLGSNRSSIRRRPPPSPTLGTHEKYPPPEKGSSTYRRPRSGPRQPLWPSVEVGPAAHEVRRGPAPPPTWKLAVTRRAVRLHMRCGLHPAAAVEQCAVSGSSPCLLPLASPAQWLAAG